MIKKDKLVANKAKLILLIGIPLLLILSLVLVFNRTKQQEEEKYPVEEELEEAASEEFPRETEGVVSEQYPVQPEPIIAKIQISPQIDENEREIGCVYSLSYSNNGQKDEALKQNAWQLINTVKNRVINGENLRTILKELAFGGTKEEVWQKQIMAYGLISITPKVTAKLREDSGILPVINYCFENREEAVQNMESSFLNTNPHFITMLNQLNKMEVTEPFIVYENIQDNRADYAWMVIALQK